MAAMVPRASMTRRLVWGGVGVVRRLELLVSRMLRSCRVESQLSWAVSVGLS